MQVDLSNRNINKWEKGLIEEGKQAEKDGLLDHALSSITRAGIALYGIRPYLSLKAIE